MTELNSQFHRCNAGRYHAPATTITVILDKAGEVLMNQPSGVVEGRMKRASVLKAAQPSYRRIERNRAFDCHAPWCRGDGMRADRPKRKRIGGNGCGDLRRQAASPRMGLPSTSGGRAYWPPHWPRSIIPIFYAMIICAGVMYPESIGHGALAQMIEINLLALSEGSVAAIQRMRERGNAGYVINFSSFCARWDADGVYGASKIAIEMIGRSLREEVERDDIRIATIVPGGFASELSRGFLRETSEMLSGIVAALGAPIDQVRGDPDRIAEAVLFILDQPININLSEIVIRPPVSIEY